MYKKFEIKLTPLYRSINIIVIIHTVLKLQDAISWNVVWVPETKRLFLFNCVCGFFIDAVVLFSRYDVTLSLWMLSFGSLLTFCDSMY